MSERASLFALLSDEARGELSDIFDALAVLDTGLHDRLDSVLASPPVRLASAKRRRYGADALQRLVEQFYGGTVRDALAGLAEAARNYHQGCECGGSGVVTACPGKHTQGCCGVCETTACECCQGLILALYNAERALEIPAMPTQADVQRYVRVLAQRDRLAQTLRLLRDTTSVGSYAHNAAVHALEDAEIADPEDEDHL